MKSAFEGEEEIQHAGVLAKVETLRNDLLANSPSPKSGYKDSKVVGEPKDSSSHELITRGGQR